MVRPDEVWMRRVNFIYFENLGNYTRLMQFELNSTLRDTSNWELLVK